MKKILFSVVLLAMAVLIGNVGVLAQKVPETVRVGIYFDGSAQETVTISAEGGVYLQCDGTDLGWLASATISQTDKNWLISGGAEPVVFWGQKMTVMPSAGLLKLNQKTYRGNIELVPSGNKMTVVNHLNTEEYLCGVVPLEMSTGWPIEALKAQAVCARTFVASNMNKYADKGFDVCNTTMSQVYGGAGVEKADTTRAVQETAGQVIEYNGELIEALYFSTSVNHKTFNSEHVWGGKVPYLVSVPDTYQAVVKPDANAWRATFTRAELQKIANSNNMQIGEVVDLKADYFPDGAVRKLTFIGTDGAYDAEKTKARSILGLRSQGFEIQPQYEQGTSVVVLGATGKVQSTNPSVISSRGELGTLSYVQSATGVMEMNLKSTIRSVVLNGTGYGHGVGMSQYGAMGMAKSGFTYDQIIKHYYTGVEITQ
ncbi:MAG: SpoIID/LytB domain-containing protein [Clostridia bacterium]|nr:SpoIID/LytB domain-containing protein [Clostridia bacterium]